jgi:hypothetical protein
MRRIVQLNQERKRFAVNFALTAASRPARLAAGAALG